MSKYLPDDEWLDEAKRLPVGGSRRIHHLREGRDNLLIQNKGDCYTAWCFSCGAGGYQPKEHARLGAAVPAYPLADDFPSDALPLPALDEPMQRRVVKWLLDKGVWPELLEARENLWFYSRSHEAVCVQTWDGYKAMRFTNPKQSAKWITLKPRKFLYFKDSVPGLDQTCIIVEDYFSWTKLRHALDTYAHFPDHYRVFCSLGTHAKDSLLLALLDQTGSALWFFDGDTAGMEGARKAHRRATRFGKASNVLCAPVGFDPKDMLCTELLNHLSVFKRE